MSLKEKKIFNDMAGRDKLRYDREMESYTPPAGDGKKGAKRKKDPNAPKRPQYERVLSCICMFYETGTITIIKIVYELGNYYTAIGMFLKFQLRKCEMRNVMK